MDKIGIIDIAQAIDTFEISVNLSKIAVPSCSGSSRANPKPKNAERSMERMDVGFGGAAVAGV